MASTDQTPTNAKTFKNSSRPKDLPGGILWQNTGGMGQYILTTGAVARYCGVASRTASKWFDAGMIKGYRIPGSADRRILAEDLHDFLKKRGLPISPFLLSLLRWEVVLFQFPPHDAMSIARIMRERCDDFYTTDSQYELGSLVSQRPIRAVVLGPGAGWGEKRRLAAGLLRDRPIIIRVAVLSDDSVNPSEEDIAAFQHIHRPPMDLELIALQISK